METEEEHPRRLERRPKIIPEEFGYLNDLPLAIRISNIKQRFATVVAIDPMVEVDHFDVRFQKPLYPIG
ncbi:hypothetical protein PTKU64_84340 [Paraburkholderia terrae]|uniref:Uncharacterized protein n=1 Tax=Paraburkholderia terrae TaxID=311230 RepID=A0ABM7U086_9BURK|nr:hypothetical protein [Paraburkholderia terrae]BCZ84759.1 hypothetical protein PTKU64_84340 [Paraburkholderia terrae]